MGNVDSTNHTRHANQRNICEVLKIIKLLWETKMTPKLLLQNISGIEEEIYGGSSIEFFYGGSSIREMQRTILLSIAVWEDWIENRTELFTLQGSGVGKVKKIYQKGIKCKRGSTGAMRSHLKTMDKIEIPAKLVGVSVQNW